MEWTLVVGVESDEAAGVELFSLQQLWGQGEAEVLTMVVEHPLLQ